MWLQIIKKDYKEIVTTFKEKDGTPIDISGQTVYFTVKIKWDLAEIDATDSNAVIKKDITTHTDPTQWETTIILTSTDTDIDPNVYSADLQLKNASWQVSSTTRFDVEIIQEVTQRS